MKRASHLATRRLGPKSPREIQRASVLTFSLILTLFTAGCTTLARHWSPKGGQPEVPSQFRHSEPDRTPENNLDSGATAWAPKPQKSPWKVFQDPALERLLDAVQIGEDGTGGNPDLAAARARVEKSHAVFQQAQAQRWLGLAGNGALRTQRDSLNQQLFPTTQREYESYELGASSSWEVDMWGRLKETARRDARRDGSEAALFEDARLSIEANLARDYFAWRVAGEEIVILDEAIRLREEDLRLENSRLELGSGVEVDVSRSKVALHTARAAAEATRRRQGKLEHAMAVLIGLAPSEFNLPSPLRESSSASLPTPPRIPAGLPLDLLRQRPDLRAAERQLEAAALEVGIRKVSFLPSISLTGTGGWSSLRSSSLLQPGSTWFDLGPEITIPLFQGGTRGATIGEAEAAWHETAANFRSTLLTAVREVDDALLDVASLERELNSQRQAVEAATDTSEIARLRHERGLASFFEVVEAERDRLTARRTENALLGERYTATISLIQALGGEW